MYLCLGQSLTPSSYSSDSTLEISEEMLQKLSLKDVLDYLADQNKYESALDYTVCSLYPELEKECRAYYDGKGKKLTELHNKRYVKKIDGIVAMALMAFYQEYQKLIGTKKLDRN